MARRKADYDSFCSLLTKEEKEELASYYKITDQIYSKENLSSQEEAQADETYLIPMLLHAQMSKMTTAQLQAMQEKQIASHRSGEGRPSHSAECLGGTLIRPLSVKVLGMRLD